MKNTLILSLSLTLISVIIINGCKPNSDTKGLYKNQEAQQKAYASYDRIMEFWPSEYQEDWVSTEYGTTHVIITGPEDATPIFFFPGLFADATMWYANVGDLSEQYRVFCLDQITYGGKSTPTELPVVDISDYANWFTSILDHYQYRSTAVAGLSYGSWLGLALAREIPESIDAVIMLDPSETFIKMDGGIAWRGIRDFAFFPNRDKYRRFFDWMGGGYSDEKSDLWLEHMLDVIEFGSVGMFDIPQHRIYTQEDLKDITMPVLITAGGKPIVYKSPQAFADAAAAALPKAQIEIIPDTGHSLNVEKSSEVNAKILQFLTSNYH